MKKTPKPVITARKKPRQARSANLVQDLLEAAIRVLGREGARRFTTVRVAEEAGISVGSLYQYFPNKEALLFRLQADEWNDTMGILEEILLDPAVAPLDRLRRAVVTFFRSEREESELRVALDDAGALIRDAPAARTLRAKATALLRRFVDDALPDAPPGSRAFSADFVFTTLEAVAEKVTALHRSRAEVDRWATNLADLLCHFLQTEPTRRSTYAPQTGALRAPQASAARR